MKKFSGRIAIGFSLVVLGSLALATTGSAGTVTFVPGSPNVGSAINSDGFFVSSDTYGLFGNYAWTSDFSLHAGGAAYSDAGLILFQDGSLTLGQLGSVSVVSTGAQLAVNLWLDTGGDGKFFVYATDGSGLFTGLNGDSYAGCGAPTVNGPSSCYVLGGNGAGGTFTLAQLQAGAVAGIGAGTPTALWIGVVGGSQTYGTVADISSITVTTVNPVPDGGATLLLLGMGFTGLGLLRRRIR